MNNKKDKQNLYETIGVLLLGIAFFVGAIVVFGGVM